MEKVVKVGEVAKKIKEKIENYDGLIRVITHYDPDGLTSGAIMVKTLLRINKKFHLTIVEHLSKEIIDELVKEKQYNDALFIFCDMGSGQIEHLIENKFNAIILDHHQPKVKEVEVDGILQLNPHIFGIDGAREVSASGICYMVARVFGFYDLSVLAITGAIGDMQHKPFIGLNKFILNEGREYRYLSIIKDLIYHCYDIPIWEAITYSTNPYIRELSNKEECLKFLKNLKIDPNKKELTHEEKQKLTNALIFYRKPEDFIVDRYTIKHKVNDAYYLSELLNACGRKGLTSVGIGVALEDDECIKIAKETYLKYKRELIEELKNVKPKKMKNIEYFKGKKGMVGIVASILVKDRPVLGYHEEGEKVKISSRGNKELIDRGLNLGKVMEVAKEFGGEGGGHDVASGASLPKIHLDEFLKRVDEIVGEQLKSKSQFR
ncbi:single-stranded-DNA-specific exonuclease RecJ [Methanotorris formicicus]|uniref:Phosphoesterase RecJ domain protein n=1 Tax=Methanotorris formicicus Mc-S-70 TaxID=647171 RepID=H1L193_9EURY|nr:DHH family phosphoesterase [Methanotorris formicicus]EHP83942.1 phosphoesterase RecJ domain protein [Methanotorris formicicus Mc-S-70]